MLKIMTIVGTRPELIKMSRVIAELDKHSKHILVHTGQNYDYDLNQVFFDDLEIRRPDYFLSTAAQRPAQTIARVIESADEVIEVEKPDAVLLYGDTNSCLAVIAAKRHKIPVFHMEAGNRCFDQRVPEELNRKVLDHLSDINLVLTEHARRYLLAEGIRPETIIKTGSHLREVLDYYQPKILSSSILHQLNLKARQFFLVSVHREETVDFPRNLHILIDTLNQVARDYDLPLMISTHPRTKKRLDSLPNLEIDSRITFMNPFGFTDYIRLQMESLCVISDSGTITEEAALLNFPAITIRNTHERPEGMDAGILIMSGIGKSSVLNAIRITIAQFDSLRPTTKKVEDYESPAVSKQVLKIVESYTGYINRTVWHKDENQC